MHKPRFDLINNGINYFTFIPEIKDGVNSLTDSILQLNQYWRNRTEMSERERLERVNVNVMFIESANKLPIVITNSESFNYFNIICIIKT